MYLLEGADDSKGVACLGGECFGTAGHGFLRFSVARPSQELKEAVEFMREAVGRNDRISAYLAKNEQYRLRTAYTE